MCICFIKISVRAIAQGFVLLFMNESSILTKNNNYFFWRVKKENVYFNLGPNKRSNLLLLINKNDIKYYKLNKTSTNESTFLEFINESLQKIRKRRIEKFK